VRFAGIFEARTARGFTLLEVFVVVVIIAILAALLLPVFSKMRARAQRVQCMANLRNLYVGDGIIRAAIWQLASDFDGGF